MQQLYDANGNPVDMSAFQQTPTTNSNASNVVSQPTNGQTNQQPLQSKSPAIQPTTTTQQPTYVQQGQPPTYVQQGQQPPTYVQQGQQQFVQPMMTPQYVQQGQPTYIQQGQPVVLQQGQPVYTTQGQPVYISTQPPVQDSRQYQREFSPPRETYQGETRPNHGPSLVKTAAGVATGVLAAKVVSNVVGGGRRNDRTIRVVGAPRLRRR